MVLDESGQLSLDFLIGFTIFLVGFIFAITMASGLLVSLMSKTVDYDAVAYRSGVILVEDAGWALDPVSNIYTPDWELINPANRDDILRTGLAISKTYPGILSEAKINEFFFTLISDDIHKKVLFDSPVTQGGISQYSYRYNIRLSSIGPGLPIETGDEVPAGRDTGYIKRVVKIKQPSSAVIDVPAIIADIADPPSYHTSSGEFIVYLDIDTLYSRDSLYRIDPLTENITIILTNLIVTPIPSDCTEVSFYNDFAPFLSDMDALDATSTDTKLETLIENVHYTIDDAAGTITLNLEPRFFFERDIKPRLDPRVFPGKYYFKFSFDPLLMPDGGVYNYGYTPPGADKPPLVPAVLEVRIW